MMEGADEPRFGFCRLKASAATRPRLSAGLHQFRERDDGGFDRLHRHRIGHRRFDPVFREGIDRLHLKPGIFVPRFVKHLDTERQIIRREAP